MPKPVRILLLNGCNINLLGTREPEIYGKETLPEIEKRLMESARQSGAELEAFQSNSEGDLIDKIQQARGTVDAIILNPAAFTHTSIGIRDAIASAGIPTIEVHLSNIYAREEFRHHSMIAPVCRGQIAGFGSMGYDLALQAVLRIAGVVQS